MDRRPVANRSESEFGLTLKAYSIAPCLISVIGLYYCAKFTFRTLEEVVHSTSLAYNRIRVKSRRRPKSKPLAVASAELKISPTAAAGTAKTSFLDLPVEIRLLIYHFALGGPLIIQVCTHSSFWGARPSHWAPGQVIRSDADPPSKTLSTIIGLGGSGLRQRVVPPRQGCVRHGTVSNLICGEEYYYCRSGRPWWCDDGKESTVPAYHEDLMRACRVVYREVLDVLYGDNTISLFGAEIAQYFVRNASPEGLRRVRFVHIALVVPSSGWDSRLQKRMVQGTIRILRDSLPSLRQLDVEVVLPWGQPKDARRFWAWLREDVLGQLRGLERFVLKVSVYKPFERPRWRDIEIEPLSAWDDGEYEALKTRVASFKEASSS